MEKENKTVEEKGIIENILLMFIIGSCIILLYMTIIFYYNAHNSYGHKVIGATYMTMNNEFYKIINNEIEKEVQQNGDRLITLDPALNQDKQLDQIQYLVDMDVDVIILNPVDWRKIKPGLELAHEANIPVIIVDSDVYDMDLVSAMIVSDNSYAGALCAREMMKDLDGGNILVLTHQEAKSAIDRIEGFENKVKDNPNFHIVERVDTQGQTERTYAKVTDILRVNPDIDVIMSLNDPAALGALASIDQLNYGKKIHVYSVDGSPDGKRLVSEHLLTGTVAQYPKKMGKTAVRIAYDILEGNVVSKQNILQVDMINEVNIDLYSIDRWQ